MQNLSEADREHFWSHLSLLPTQQRYLLCTSLFGDGNGLSLQASCLPLLPTALSLAAKIALVISKDGCSDPTTLGLPTTWVLKFLMNPAEDKLRSVCHFPVNQPIPVLTRIKISNHAPHHFAKT